MRIASGIVLVAVLAGCGSQREPDRPPSPAPNATAAPATPVPVHVSSSGGGQLITLTEMRGERTLYTVRAPSFEADSVAGADASGSGSFVAPQISFFDRNGGATVATAPKAELRGADKSVVMTGGVRARSQDGNVLTCDRLRYDGRSERVHGNGNVRLVTPGGLVLVGDTLDGDARLQNVVVKKAP